MFLSEITYILVRLVLVGYAMLNPVVLYCVSGFVCPGLDCTGGDGYGMRFPGLTDSLRAFQSFIRLID